MYPIETPIREDHHHVSLGKQRHETLDNGICIFFVVSDFALGGEIDDDAFGVETLVFGELVEAGDLREEHSVGFGECLGQGLLENISTRRVRARFENRP